MFRAMRRNRQALPPKDCITLLERGTSGVLALLGDDGYPYAVPLSYVYSDGKIYFHCAKTGHKLDALLTHPKTSFCVIGQDQIVPEEFTTYFRSVIAFGTIHILEDATRKRDAIEKLALKYAPESSMEERSSAIQREWQPLCMLEMVIEHISGKEAIELTQVKR